MDTDDLTDEIYDAILTESENFHHDLTLQFGLLSYNVDNEADYLKEVKELIYEFKKYKKYDLESIFFDDIPKLSDFQRTLDKILKNIEDVRIIQKIGLQ